MIGLGQVGISDRFLWFSQDLTDQIWWRFVGTEIWYQRMILPWRHGFENSFPMHFERWRSGSWCKNRMVLTSWKWECFASCARWGHLSKILRPCRKQLAARERSPYKRDMACTDNVTFTTLPGRNTFLTPALDCRRFWFVSLICSGSNRPNLMKFFLRTEIWYQRMSLHWRHRSINLFAMSFWGIKANSWCKKIAWSWKFQNEIVVELLSLRALV